MVVLQMEFFQIFPFAVWVLNDNEINETLETVLTNQLPEAYQQTLELRHTKICVAHFSAGIVIRHLK